MRGTFANREISIMRDRTTPLGTAAWVLAGLLASVGIAWLAAKLHSAGFAPVVLLPLGVGVALGAAITWLAQQLRQPRLGSVLLIVLLSSIVVVVAEHAWLYQEFRQEWHEALRADPRVALFRPREPWSIGAYFRHEATPQQVVLWSVDAALIIIGSLAAALLLHRQLAQSESPPDATNPTATPDT